MTERLPAAILALALAASPALAQQQNQAPPPPQQNQAAAPPAQAGQQGMNMSQNEIQQVQQALNQKGFNVGRTDGILGPRTEGALRSFQQAQKLPATGQPDQQTLAALGINMQPQGMQQFQGNFQQPRGNQQQPQGTMQQQPRSGQ